MSVTIGTKLLWDLNQNTNIVKEMRLETLSTKFRPFRFGLHVLMEPV